MTTPPKSENDVSATETTSRTKTIVVAGDTTIDWFMYPAKDDDKGPEQQRNWRLNSGLRAAALPGGAYLYGEFIRTACDGLGVNLDMPKVPEKLTIQPPEEVIHSNATLAMFRIKGGAGPEETVLRVRDSFGYIGPSDASVRSDPPEKNLPDADIVVLDDAGNGFRDKPAAGEHPWANALYSAAKPVIVHKMSRPLGKGALWDFLRENHSRRHVVVINARDIRETDGVQISRSLSWERTAKEFVFQMGRSSELQELRQCRCLIVRFETDGAIIHFGGDIDRDTIVYDPGRLEGGYAATIEGTMDGLTILFTASIVAQLARNDSVLDELADKAEPAKPGALSSLAITTITDAVKTALQHTRRLVKLGFGYVDPAQGNRPSGEATAAPGRPGKTEAVPGRVSRAEPGITYRYKEVFQSAEADGKFDSCTIDRARDLWEADPQCWTILGHKTNRSLLLAAEEVVRCGLDKSDRMKGVPVGRFGGLQTVDRMEIESFAAIRELIVGYRATEKPERPLCLAVFGPPGAGKSFAVKQVALSVCVKETEMLRFNVSQFHKYRDLAAALHRVRNIALKGNLPFVFFDEFDTPLDGCPLGWLKYFLAPMQDGEFRDYEIDHPIGKAIFVFAGGTFSSFDSFVQNAAGGDRCACQAEGAAEAPQRCREAKGPDFVSRLQGHINILGPNRQYDCDHGFLIRRAMLLRNMLKYHPMARNLFDNHGVLQIDPGVLRALLCVSEYRHGARSMTAIFDMSALAGQRRFTLSALASQQLLNAHVDGEEFLMLAHKERYQSLLSIWNANPLSAELAQRAGKGPLSFAERERVIVDAVAELIHDAYRRCCEKMGECTSASTRVYSDLSAEHKKSNQDAAEDLPAKLRDKNYGLRLPPDGSSPQLNPFPKEVVSDLARREHGRYVLEKRMQDIRLGKVRSEEEKTHPDMKKYDELSAEAQEKDRSAVAAIPEILLRIGYEVYRMDDDCAESKSPKAGGC